MTIVILLPACFLKGPINLFLTFLSPFLTCVNITVHVIAIGWTSVHLSVRPSVCPSHAGIVSKRLNLSSNCLHCLVGW